MSKFIEELAASLDILLSDPFISTTLLIPLVLAPISMIFRMFFRLMDLNPVSFASSIADACSWLGEKVVDLMCKSERGFYLAYKLGWAKAGVHFFDCGVDCDKCPKYDQCMDELRVLRDVTQVPPAAPAPDPKNVLHKEFSHEDVSMGRDDPL